MADIYQSLLSSPIGRQLLTAVSLPVPVELDRHCQSQPSFITGNVLIGGAANGRLTDVISKSLAASNAHVQVSQESPSKDAFDKAADKAELKLTIIDPNAEAAKFKGLVFDATGIENSTQLRSLYDFFHPVMKKMQSSGRIVVLGLPPESCKEPAQQIAQRALEGFVRTVAKEVGKKGAVAQLVYVTKTAEKLAESAIQFFLSPRTAFVDGQVVRIGKGKFDAADFNWNLPLKGKVALVTGSSRGIGEAIAETLARDGAKVICLDIPAAEADLKRVASHIDGCILPLDITDPAAPKTIAEFCKKEFGGLDVIVHNAGVTRDKTLGGMPDHFWDMVIDINLTSEERINAALLDDEILNDGGRIVCVSSMSGVAGNFGQSNYATSKAGVIGMVNAMAPVLAKRNITINAVAPGFIETQMTAAMPMAPREVGRRLNSLKQGGQPVDVAEAIAFFASPASAGANGNTIRVCGQNLIGA
ncbi:3-oxoacyl-ACP reductase [Gammaproteobacteria bacterium 42_54_T18]|nr:3-oxoacyl-ACP reductase [Gammaproteobacteria bacterium 42_54_T18]